MLCRNSTINGPRADYRCQARRLHYSSSILACGAGSSHAISRLLKATACHQAHSLPKLWQDVAKNLYPYTSSSPQRIWCGCSQNIVQMFLSGLKCESSMVT
ncbi:unnamed protein product [Lota lota]